MDDLVKEPERDDSLDGFHRNNELGGYKYTPEQEDFLHRLSIYLRNRTNFDNSKLQLRPDQYMKYFVKGAGIVAETAQRLSEASPIHDFYYWVEVLTGFKDR